ncbi:MAG: Replicative DNA helicase [candidate division CPR1 bacterium ADurb.Bin160]|uniref:Replicative DNA helicase n=1 Tax=candidate division CPR1 bacterium ADurb.Bin160 TaxID=1852826 RepID=A0A1V5ZJI5_9BACT|nr:MAG: Replicative DNA helicase [candidate division CPR1 bacterium ADurb.Bin160]
MSEQYVEKFDFENLETDFIASFFHDRKMWVDLKDHIDPTYFNNQNISTIFKIFKLFFDKYNDFPSKDQLKVYAKKKNFDKDGYKTINDIYAKTLEVKDIEFLRTEANSFIKNSKLERAILKSVDLLEQKKYPEIYDAVTEAVHWNPEVNLGTNYSNAQERYARLFELITGVVSTPWETLNYFLSGGFYRKELYLFVASSSVGKSIALDQVALHSWDKLGLNVAIITLEMSEERKGQRMDACKFGIPVTSVFDERLKIIKSFEHENKKNKLFIKEMPQTATTADIEQYLYQIQLYENVKIDILIVDYMDIMSPRRARTGNDYQDQGSVGTDLRDLAKKLAIPVVSASQFSRGALDIPIEELNEGKIADSWKKIMIADGVIAMALTPEERRNGKINFKGLKNRNGLKDFIIKLKIQYELLKITDMHEIISNGYKASNDDEDEEIVGEVREGRA